ncbi:unnamed protein product [Urochloa decumbens]|uniref:HTH OST-type domain-containing protein n=1 Tax=Urochloa decumbens TaxID=240449 RepID=A0ABC9ANC7_9POAL
MFACRARRLLGVRVRPASHGILPRDLAPHASSPWRGSSAAPQRSYHHQLQRDEVEDEWEEESKAVKVAVWWDFQKCCLPPSVNPRCLGPRVTAALRGAGIRGPVEITAFGDVTRAPRADLEVLTDTGITLSHSPSSGNSGSYQALVPDLVSWIARNPPPAHFLLISGDGDYANVLHRLRMSNYNVLLSCPNVGSKMLRTAATIMWQWEPLVKGADLEPKYLNQPPDGLSSWYGQYMECGHDLLMKPKNPMALPGDTKERKIPEYVVIGIKKVLHFYPEGISVSDLREELKRVNVFLHSRYFGYKRFSSLLKAMPDVVKFIDPLPGDDTLPAVVGVFKSSVESSEQSSSNRLDSAQSSTEEKLHNDSGSVKLPSLDVHPSSLELPSCTERKTLETEAPSSALEQLSGDQRKAPELTQRAEPPSNHVEADVTLVGDVPSPPSDSDASSIDQRNADKKTERPVNCMEADKLDAAGTPSSSGVQVNMSDKRGLFEHISSLWNGRNA